jgi:hypothetical protein
MNKSKPDEAAVREAWIQEVLGERKYRQLRMHLNSALRLLGELALVNEGRAPHAMDAKAPDSKSDTTKAMAALTERLQAVSRGQRTIPIRELPQVASRKRAKKR